MKKILSIVLCVAFMCLCFSGCGSSNEMTEENITATVNTVTEALKNFDTKKLKKYVKSSTLNTIMTYAEGHEQFSELGKAIFSNLQVEIEDIDMENNTVTLTVSNKDLYSVASDFTSNLKNNYSSIQLLTMLSDDDFLDSNLASLCESIDEAEMLPIDYQIQLTVEQGKKNLVLSFNEQAENIISGGALLAIKEIYS